MHPDTKAPYRWLDGDPLVIPLADLPEVTEEQILEFLGKAEVVLGKYGKPEKPEPVNGKSSAHCPPPPDENPARRAYAEAALAEEVKRVATAFAGGCNAALNVAALKLGHLVASGWLDQGRVERSLEDAAQAAGLARDDGLKSVRDTIASGLEAGICEPREPPERTTSYSGNGATTPSYSEPATEPSSWGARPAHHRFRTWPKPCGSPS